MFIIISTVVLALSTRLIQTSLRSNQSTYLLCLYVRFPLIPIKWVGNAWTKLG